ncbi:shikimate dehydrogenase [Planctomycetota bacterium]|nr:shikimate dehydrogenase [Planctomycetota bacterium]
MMTKLTVPIMVYELEQGLVDSAKAAAAGADLVEFRIDHFTEDMLAIGDLVKGSKLPCIVTCRPVWEGGEYDGDEMERMSALQHAPGRSVEEGDEVGVDDHGVGPAYIDCELLAWEKSANIRQKVMNAVRGGSGLILSSHDFKERPRDLMQRVEKMVEADECRVIKVAWAAKSLRDNLEAFEIIERKWKPTIALCMGEYGLASRVLAKKFGALLTFAALGSDKGTAPGQPTVEEIKGLYRWDRLGKDTKVYGVVGYPVGHSMSPQIHNAGFDEVDFDGVYLPLPVGPSYESFKATIGTWLDYESLDFKGCSVTIPHKGNLLDFVREEGGEIEALTEKIGAANTLVKRDDGSLYAFNTDYAAALDSVCDRMGIERDGLKGKKVVVLGAGGVSRAIVAGFAGYGAEVVVYNRTVEKAEALAKEFGASAKAMSEVNAIDCEVLINCTPMGMHPNEDEMPVEADVLKAGMVVFDTIYNPLETKLLKAAKAKGCLVVSGGEMFVRQAAGQFEAWTGKKAPLDVFERELRKHLDL